MPSKIVKVAAVQAAPVAFDLNKSIEKISCFTSEAAKNGADLVAFPYVSSLPRHAHSESKLICRSEGFLSAYPWRYAFDATIGAREPRGRKWYARYYNSAISLSSPEFDTLRAIAEANKTFLSVGIIEKDEVGGATLYCTSVLIGKDGTILSSHRKVIVQALNLNYQTDWSTQLIPTAAERLIWGRGAGDGLKVVDTELGKVGGLICWENYMPAARLALYQQGIEYVSDMQSELL
jgi:predicted amidohydrolase